MKFSGVMQLVHFLLLQQSEAPCLEPAQLKQTSFLRVSACIQRFYFWTDIHQMYDQVVHNRHRHMQVLYNYLLLGKNFTS